MTSLYKLKERLAGEERKHQELVLEFQQLLKTNEEHKRQFGTPSEYVMQKVTEIRDALSWCYVRVLRLRADFAEATIKARRFMNTEIPDELPETLK